MSGIAQKGGRPGSAGDEPGAGPATGRRHSWRRAAVFAGALVGFGFLVGSPPAAEAEETWTFEIGALDTDPGQSIAIEGQTFFAVQERFARADPAAVIRIPLATLLGPGSVTVENAVLDVQDATSSVSIRGSSTDFLGATDDDPADVLVLVDWAGGSEDDPTVVVSWRVKAGSTLAGALGDAGGLSGVDLRQRVYTVGTTPLEASDLQHIARPGNLPPLATAYFEELYGQLPAPQVPALTVLDERLFLSLGVDLAGFPDVTADAFGWGNGDRAVFEGGLGIGFGQPFEPTTATWSLGAVLPASPADSALMPDFLDFASDVRWRAAIAFDADAGRVSLTAGVNASTNLFGGTQDLVLQARLSFPPGDPSLATVEVLADVAGDWPAPFGIEWLDVDRIKITGTFGRAVPDGGTAPVTTAAFSVDGFAKVAGKDVTVSVSGRLAGSEPSGTVEIRMNDTVTAAEVLDVVDDAAPVVLPVDVPASVLDTAIDNVALRVDFTTATSGDPPTSRQVATVSLAGTATVHLPVPGDGIDIGAALLVSVGTDRNVTIGVRADSDLTLSSLLPGVDLPFDFGLATADGAASFGFVFSTVEIDKPINELPVPVRRFLRPLHGFEEDESSPFLVELPAGASVLGSFELPEQLADVVDRLGWQSRVIAHGTLPVFRSGTEVRLALEVALQSESLLPDFVHQVDGSIVVSGTAGAQSTIKVEFEGDLTLRIRSGLPAEVADPLNAAGIPVGVDRPVQSSAECATGQALPEKRTDPDVLRCYDLLRVRGTFGIEAKADGTVELSLSANVSTPGAGNVWYPFGLTWLGLDDLRIVGSIEAHPAGTVDFELGFAGDVEALGGNRDLLAAVQLSLKLLVEPPWVAVELDGIRIASGSGFDTGDLIDLQHLVADAAGAGGSPFDLGELGLPDFALRNVDVSFSPKGVPALCMPRGLTLSADLYIDPSSDAPRVDPSCQNQQLVIPDEADRCVNRRSDGCIASGRLRVATNGIFGQFQIPGFDVGPLHLDDLEIDLAVAVQSAHLIGRAGARIDNPLGTDPDPIASGRIEVKFQPTTFSVYGELDTLGFRALVDTTAGYDVFQAAVPEFRLHVLLATDQYHIGEPSFVSALAGELDDALNPLGTIADVAGSALDLADDDPSLSDLVRLTDAMEAIGVDVPYELEEFNSRAGGFVSDFDFAIDHVGGSVFDLVMNGIPSYGASSVCSEVAGWFGAEETCDHIPGFGGTSGLCDAVFPASEFPGLRDGDGDCTIGRLVDTVIFPSFEDAMGQIVDVTGLDVRALVEALSGLDGDQPLLKLECAELLVDVGEDTAFGELAVAGSVFGLDFGFRAGFDATDPVGSLGDLVQDVVEQLVDPTSVDCIGFNHDLFVATPDVGDPEPTLIITAPDVVDEGEQFSLEGAFGVALAADRVVEIDWGDGEVEQVTAAAGEMGFTVEHAYADDDPSGTASDLVQIVATDRSSGAGSTEAPRQVSEQVTVSNVAPTVVSFVPAGTVEEGRAQTFTVTLADPGVADTHTVYVDWGDQHVSSASLPAGQMTVDLSHTHRDDDPTGTPVDPYDVSVVVVDDDLGTGSRSVTQQVHNVAPGGLAVAVVSETVVEGAPVEFHVTWHDPGLADTHSVFVDWADGADPVAEAVVRGARDVTLTHTWGDNGSFPVVIGVIDDDTGRVLTTVPVEVDNVDPVVAIDRSSAYAAPGGATFLTRVDSPVEVAADLADPGSDDETFTWAWGDGLADVVVDRVNPPADDPLPSPSIQPRNITVTADHTYDLSCLYWLDLGVVDDDGGPHADRAPVVVVGDETDAQPRGWWYEEYLHFGLGQPSTRVDDRTKACHLLVADHMSTVFGDVVALATPEDAVAVLHPDVLSPEAKLDRELLAVWLNYAGGAIGSDADGRILPEFAEVVYEAERVRLDPSSSDGDLHEATMALQALQH